MRASGHLEKRLIDGFCCLCHAWFGSTHVHGILHSTQEATADEKWGKDSIDQGPVPSLLGSIWIIVRDGLLGKGLSSSTPSYSG